MRFPETRLLVKVKSNEGAKWYGKISTAVFYVVMVLLLFFEDIPEKIANGLLAAWGLCMALAFVMYGHRYSVLEKRGQGEPRPQEP